ncbi:hypothetical protein ACFL52_01300 [Candidatus Margulisiibacteriota bacterium]
MSNKKDTKVSSGYQSKDSTLKDIKLSKVLRKLSVVASKKPKFRSFKQYSS